MDDEPPLDWTDPEAVAACVERHRPALLAYVSRRMSAALRQRVDPEDILQEVCLTACRNAAGGMPTRGAFGWLCHVAEQRIIDAHRRHLQAAKRGGGRDLSIDGGGGDDGGRLASILAASITSPSSALSREAREQRLATAIAALPEAQRQAIELRFVAGLPTREIAARLGKSDVAVRVLLSRTIKALETRLGAP